MRLIVVPVPVALFAALAIGAWAGGVAPQSSTTTSTNKKKKSPARHRARSATASVAPSASKIPAKTSSATSAKRPTASKSKRPVVIGHRPQQPSPDRYKEIQQALAGKGYFHGEPDGTWGSASVESLKRFQHDQNLAEDGKIGSLSLIALGLGPKRQPEPEQKTP